jgi:group I intron endonuclease
MGLIYKITNPINEVYIGSTKREVITTRKAEHKYRSKKNSKGLIYDSFRKYGFNNHSFEVISEVDNANAIELEHFIIQEFLPKLNIVKKHNATAQGKIWVNNGFKEFQLLPEQIKTYKNIKKGRIIKNI